MAVNDEVQMELEMLKAVAGDDHVEEPRIRDDAPQSMRKFPTVRILVTRAIDMPPELVLWLGFHDSNYPGNGGEECIPLIQIEREENAEIKHRPEMFTEMAITAAKAEAGQMCINQVYQRIVDGMAEADETAAKKAGNDARSAAEREIEAANVDPTIRIGTQLTPEIFKEWKAKFDAERLAKLKKGDGAKKVSLADAAAAASAASSGTDSSKKVRLTGKQMWDQTMANADWKLFAGEADGEEEDIEDIDFVFEDEEDEDEEEQERNYTMDDDDDEGDQ
jgi:hypothetical protein